MLGGCASTTVDMSGPGARERWCDPSLSALVLWTPDWRPDQKDVPAREAAAQRGIDRFFSGSGCFSKAVVHRSSTVEAGFQRVIFIKVRELGPIVVIGSPSILEGGTEVVLDIKVLDTPAEFRTHWKNGGAFVIKGVGTLEQDMAEALGAAFK